MEKELMRHDYDDAFRFLRPHPSRRISLYQPPPKPRVPRPRRDRLVEQAKLGDSKAQEALWELYRCKILIS